MLQEGRDKAAQSLLDLQPTAVLELFKLYIDRVNQPSVFMTFHGGSVFANNVTWQGLEYLPIPIETEGFGVFGDGTLPRPKIRVANKDKIITVLLQKYQDFKNAVIYRKKVFVKHLDAVNFDGGNPFGIADPYAEISEEKYFFGQKTVENVNYVEFELNLPLDLDNFEVNQRNINAKYCYWQYRGLGCRYEGAPIEKSNGERFVDVNEAEIPINLNEEVFDINKKYTPVKDYVIGDVVYLENRSIILGRESGSQEPIYLKTWYVCAQDHLSTSPQKPEDNPSYWQQDGCTKKISACKKRFTRNDSTISYWTDETISSFPYIRNLNSPNEYNNPTSSVGLSFATKDPIFTDANGLLTHNEGSSPFTIVGWIRNKANHDILSRNERSIFATNLTTRDNNFILRTAGLSLSQRPVPLGRTRKNDDRSISHVSLYSPNNAVSISSPTDAGNFSFFSYTWDGPNNQNVTFSLDERKESWTRRRLSNSTNDFFSLFCDLSATDVPTPSHSYIGDIAQVVVWNAVLTDEELTTLRTTYKNSSTNAYAPIPYADIGDINPNLKDEERLVAWWDMVMDEEHGNRITDEHNVESGIHLSMYGHTASTQSTENYERQTKEKVLITEETSSQRLPFGGFPGTDGYDYASRNS